MYLKNFFTRYNINIHTVLCHIAITKSNKIYIIQKFKIYNKPINYITKRNI